MSRNRIPQGLMTMEDVAKYIGKHPQQLREYFAAGMLAEPAFSVKRGVRITRRFTLQEAERMKYDFEHAKYGTFARRRRKK